MVESGLRYADPRILRYGAPQTNAHLKQTRSLAREEFLKKALIKKISKGMGLVEDEKWG